MAAGKTMKKSFYTEGEGVKYPDIAMPPLPEDNKSAEFGTVPEELPQEVQKEMNNEVENVEESVQEQPEQEVEVNQEQESEQQQEQPEKKTDTDSENSAAQSFKAIREAKKKAEEERDMLLQQVLEYQKSQQAQSKQQSQPEPPPIDDDINFDIDEDGLVEGRYVKKVTNKIRSLEKQLKAYESQSKQQSVESKIKSQFPDFEEVVSEENIQMLNNQFPEIASSLRDTSDLYSKAVSTYNIMKRFGIHRDDPHSEERIKALKNTQKPKPIASVSPQQGDSPLSKANAFANGLTEDLKAQLRREMLAARRSA